MPYIRNYYYYYYYRDCVCVTLKYILVFRLWRRQDDNNYCCFARYFWKNAPYRIILFIACYSYFVVNCDPDTKTTTCYNSQSYVIVFWYIFFLFSFWWRLNTCRSPYCKILTIDYSYNLNWTLIFNFVWRWKWRKSYVYDLF